MKTTKLTARELEQQLAEQRAVLGVQRDDDLTRRERDARYRDALAEVQEQTAALDRERQARIRDAEQDAALHQLYRRAARDGARARIRTDIQRTAEMRALRIARVRSVALLAGIPVLLAFGGWSTSGVQAGVVRILGLDTNSAGWWSAWGVEPALLTIVALIIIGRAVLRSSGGNTDGKAAVAEWSALATSVALNMAGGWHGEGWSAVGGALAHSVGPLGAAGTAFLIGLFDGYVAAARPWDGAPRLADLDLTPPGPAGARRAPATAPAGDDLAVIVDAIADPVPTAPQPATYRPRWRPNVTRRPRRMARPQPQITIVLPEPKPTRRPAEPTAKTPTSAGGRGRPSKAQKVAAVAKRNPGLSPAEIAQKANVHIDTVKRHLPAMAANGHDFTKED